jgi:hypothetical protein
MVSKLPAPKERKVRTDHLADLVLLRGVRLLCGFVEDDVEEDVVAAEDAAHFATALDLDEQPFVHKLPAAAERGCSVKIRYSINDTKVMDTPF